MTIISNLVVEQTLFWLSSLVAVVGAIGTVASKNTIRSAVALLVTIVGIAGLYLTLCAQLIAAIQLLVYAGAVVVLFVFVIMLLGGQGDIRRDHRSIVSRTVAVTALVVGAVSTTAVLARVGIGGIHRFSPAPAELGSVSAMAKALFSEGLIVVELVAVLLTTAIVGVMAIARSRRVQAQLQDQPKTRQVQS